LSGFITINEDVLVTGMGVALARYGIIHAGEIVVLYPQRRPDRAIVDIRLLAGNRERMHLREYNPEPEVLTRYGSPLYFVPEHRMPEGYPAMATDWPNRDKAQRYNTRDTLFREPVKSITPSCSCKWGDTRIIRRSRGYWCLACHKAVEAVKPAPRPRQAKVKPVFPDWEQIEAAQADRKQKQRNRYYRNKLKKEGA
jgi:hypothetical protein